LKWLLAIGVVLQGNNLLSLWARNNWLFKTGEKQWIWPDEIAVVTGGSGGIGALIVTGLAHKGVKVAVFDMQPLPDELKGGKFPKQRLKCGFVNQLSRLRNVSIWTWKAIRSKLFCSPLRAEALSGIRIGIYPLNHQPYPYICRPAPRL
jgi:hypothetical protein